MHKSYKIVAPFPDPKPDENAAYKLQYTKPSNINVVGSYVLKTMVKSDSSLVVDMVVVMPASIFQEKDYLNYRYFYKRAYYLACIAGSLQNSVKEEFSLTFEYANGNSLQPILVVRPKSGQLYTRGKSTQTDPCLGVKDKSIGNYAIHIMPSAPQNTFLEAKLRPHKNSIRPKESSEKDSLIPTPFYNASVRSDSNYLSYLKVLHSASKQAEGFTNACILGRIWLRQRGFGGALHAGGFGHFEWAAITALLLEGGGPKGRSVLSVGYSSYQMFKAVLQFLSTNDLSAKPLAYKVTDYVLPKSETPMFYDGPRGQNLLYKLTPWSYAMLKEEATASLTMLNDSAFDQFESTFITRTAQPLQRFDSLIKIPVPSSMVEKTGDHQSRTDRFSSKIFRVLREGLSDRVRLIDIQTSPSLAWHINTDIHSSEDEVLLVCVVFDPANIDRLVDHGPSAEEKKAAAKFQKFWGDKAELRRFKDGSILESLVWSSGSPYSIFRDIVVYLVRRHFDGSLSSRLSFTGEGFDKLLQGHGTGLKSFDALKSAFNTLEKNFRDLEGLPLQLRQLSPVDSQLRYSSLDTPNFSQSSPLSAPADILVQFEGSGRWPDDVVAIQRTKIAFLLKIGALLEEADSNITARVGVENEEQTLQNCAYLDVIYETGAAFRLRIQTDREQTLLERVIKEKSTNNRTREEAVVAMSTFKRTAVQLPLHSQSIATHCTRFPLLSPTIRLLKLWLDKHMLSGHVSEELAELLAVRTFLQPYPWKAPSSAMTGFLRTLLFISKWDWRLVPLIVDFTGTMTSTDVSTINTRLEAWRKIDPGMNRTVLFAGSNHDTTGTAFTDQGPSKMVAARMTALARSACKVVKDHGVDLDPRSLFASTTADYDFVIHISSKFLACKQKKQGSNQKFKNLEVQSDANLDKVGFNPVELYLAELEKVYSDCVVLFYSKSGGTIVAGLWNPQTVEARSFKVNLAYATKPVAEAEKDEVSLDKVAILAEIVRLGGDMISKVETR